MLVKSCCEDRIDPRSWSSIRRHDLVWKRLQKIIRSNLNISRACRCSLEFSRYLLEVDVKATWIRIQFIPKSVPSPILGLSFAFLKILSRTPYSFWFLGAGLCSICLNCFLFLGLLHLLIVLLEIWEVMNLGHNFLSRYLFILVESIYVSDQSLYDVSKSIVRSQ